MRKNLFFKGDITLENVKALSDELDKVGPDAAVDLWFDSQGGHRDASRVLAFIVDTYPGSLTIKITWAASSCAFLFMLENCRRFEFLKGSFSAVHKVARDVATRDLDDHLGADFILMAGTEDDNNNTIGTIRSHLTGEEIDRFNRGSEVVLTADRATKAIRAVRLARGLIPPEDMGLEG